MKLIRAEFENFRLLRDLEIRFSTDADKKLTVIRAANESGKTTILHGLQWALYGDDALPGKGVDFRLHPIDWDESAGRRVPIMATVEFEVITHRRGPDGQTRESRKQYRIIRSANEEIDTAGRRSPSSVKLYALTDTGANEISAPEAVINEELPPELREVFFTDGDRALSFIEADVALATKRDRVQRAIRALLGLGVIEDAIRHVTKTAADANRQAKQLGGNGELAKVADRLTSIEEEMSKLTAAADDARQQFASFDEKLEEKNRQIQAALQKGDREALAKNLEGTRKRVKQLDDLLDNAAKDHSQLFRGRTLAVDLLGPVLESAFSRLQVLADQRKIPNSTVPVLEDRLDIGTCICGEPLGHDTPGMTRRAHIEQLIKESKKADELQGTLTQLYYEARNLQPQAGSQWIIDYDKIFRGRDSLSQQRQDEGRQLRSIQLELDNVPDTDVQSLRDVARQYKESRDRFLSKGTEYETKLAGLRREKDELTDKRDRLLREEKKGERVRSHLEVTQDVLNVLRSAYDRITQDELHKVSDLMNSIFLEMIGADPQQGALIQSAEINGDFDIIVYGPNGRTLNPDRDLNGASRRALTLAFILALTRVSEVEAPNVIDTPLGMTSGYVKRSILRTAIRESSQLILFLTHDEIAGCEDIIDDAAGRVITLTNPAHYPKMLVNDPHVRERKVLTCDCDHRHTCEQCERRRDLEPVELA